MKHLIITTVAAVLLVGCGDAVSSKPITEPIVQAKTADKIIPQVAQAVIADSSSSAKNSSLSLAEQASNKAANATNEEEQWEYLVVSFGKTQFSEINQNVQTGSSKLGIFQDFADLLGGSESVNTQNKLDILGRFGWQLVNIVGSIGGDQQMVLKRKRIPNRIDLEKNAMLQLADILKNEKEKRERLLEEFFAQLKKNRSEKTKLIELDALEKANREAARKKEITEKIESSLQEVEDKLAGWTETRGVSLLRRALEVSTFESSYNERKMNDYGNISFTIDLSRNQLKGNKYRRSDFVKFSERLASEVYSYMNFYKATGYASYNITYSIEFKFILVWEGEELLTHSVERDRQLHRF